MLDVRAILDNSAPAASLPSEIRALCAKDLAKLTTAIDSEGVYPESVLRELGRLGAFASHLPLGGAANLNLAIEAMAMTSEYCLSTSFCVWCQDAFVWYIFASENEYLKQRIGYAAATGEILGGTGLSNPMKYFHGVEPMRLKAVKTPGGYLVKGSLPYVSNLGVDHYFGAVFEANEDRTSHHVMGIIPCAAEGVSLSAETKFVALDGTRTFSVQLKDVFVPHEWILADPIDDYLKKIRAGFVLLQSGMAFGLIRDCIRIMQRAGRTLEHVNKYIDIQPEQVAERLSTIERAVADLAVNPLESDPAYWRAVIEARLAAGEASIEAAHAVMLHCGARGYVLNAAAQRRLRESYFVAIVTPATKQLRKMLAEMPN